MKVIAETTWLVHWGGCNNSAGGLEGRLLKLSLDDGLIFYVRENLKRNSFVTSSGQRMAMKRGEKTGGIDVLELCCPSQRWNEVAAIVKASDGLDRPVLSNRNFSRSWADLLLTKQRKAAG